MENLTPYRDMKDAIENFVLHELELGVPSVVVLYNVINGANVTAHSIIEDFELKNGEAS